MKTPSYSSMGTNNRAPLDLQREAMGSVPVQLLEQWLREDFAGALVFTYGTACKTTAEQQHLPRPPP